MDDLDHLLPDYEVRCQPWAVVKRALREHGVVPKDDHIEIRTVSLPDMMIEDIAEDFIASGYVFDDPQQVEPEYQLRVRSLIGDGRVPRIIIKEFQIDTLPNSLVEAFITTVGSHLPSLPGRPWIPYYETYQQVESHSRFAAWFLAFGWCIYQRALAVESMSIYRDLSHVLVAMKEQGFQLMIAPKALCQGPVIEWRSYQ